MRVKAEEFNKKPASLYRAADKGEKVEIEHNHYPDVVFELVTKEKDKDDAINK